jgi:hypothetical protein
VNALFISFYHSYFLFLLWQKILILFKLIIHVKIVGRRAQNVSKTKRKNSLTNRHASSFLPLNSDFFGFYLRSSSLKLPIFRPRKSWERNFLLSQPTLCHKILYSRYHCFYQLQILPTASADDSKHWHDRLSSRKINARCRHQ